MKVEWLTHIRRGAQISHAFVGENFKGQMSACGQVDEEYLSRPFGKEDSKCKKCLAALKRRKP